MTTMHIAETPEQAMADIRFGLEKWIYYFREIANLPVVPDGPGDPVEAMVSSGMAIIGTPDDAAARIQQLVDESGGFGAFLLMAHNWADWAATRKSYELMARYVFPKFQQSNVNRQSSMDWVRTNKDEFTGQMRAAVGARIVQHMMEKGADNISPMIVEAITGQAKPAE